MQKGTTHKKEPPFGMNGGSIHTVCSRHLHLMIISSPLSNSRRNFPVIQKLPSTFYRFKSSATHSTHSSMLSVNFLAIGSGMITSGTMPKPWEKSFS